MCNIAFDHKNYFTIFDKNQTCVFSNPPPLPVSFPPAHYQIHRGYQMSVGLILNLLNELNKSILCEPLASMILFYLSSSINLVMNLHKFNILIITYPKRNSKNVKKNIIFHRHAYCIMLMFSALSTLFV